MTGGGGTLVAVKVKDRVKRTVRLPRALAVKLEECAEQNGCSVNAEIVRRLRASVEGYSR
jgi:predicted HicB family RNase H-like nuclease